MLKGKHCDEMVISPPDASNLIIHFFNCNFLIDFPSQIFILIVSELRSVLSQADGVVHSTAKV